MKSLLHFLKDICLAGVIALGLATIIATSSGDDDPAPAVSYRIATESVDEDANGDIDYVLDYAYNSDGDVATKTKYTGSAISGDPTELTTYTYDDDGTLLREEVDDGIDDVVDQVTTFSYIGGTKTGEVDIGNDDVIDVTLTYNSRDDITQRSFEINNISVALTYSHSYNPETDFLEQTVERTYQDGNFTDTTTHTYTNTEDDNGNLYKVEKDTDSNDTVDEIKYYTYERE